MPAVICLLSSTRMEVAGSWEGIALPLSPFQMVIILTNSSPTVHGSLMEDLARQTSAAVVFPYYSPAPEKQYPTQFEQSFAVLKYIVENGEKHDLKTDTLA